MSQPLVCPNGHKWHESREVSERPSSGACPVCGLPARIAYTDPRPTTAPDDRLPSADETLRSTLAQGRPASTNDERGSAAPATSQKAEVALGSQLTIIRSHAQGGLGRVCLARDEQLQREVALKQMRTERADDPECRSRFVAEAEITGQLEHPGIVPVYGLGRDAEGRPCYAMKFVHGRTLDDAIMSHHSDPTALSFRDLLRSFVDICQTVAYAHSRNVIHRDLKPSNVMLGEYGETLVVDWGLAKRADAVEGDQPGDRSDQPSSGEPPGLTREGQVLGTPAYMAPEQASGQREWVGPASDIYGLGAILYTLLTGRTPYAGSEAADVLSRVREGAPDRPGMLQRGVPRPLEAVCLKAMARHPQDRYASASDLAHDMERWLADEQVSVYREPFWVGIRRWVGRHRVVRILVSAAVAGTFVAIVLLTINNARLRVANLREQNAKKEAREKERLATAERDAKEIQRRRAEKSYQGLQRAVKEMLVEVGASDLHDEPGTELMRRRLLQKALEFYNQMRTADSSDPDVVRDIAAADMEMGAIEVMLGHTAEAETAYRAGIGRLDRLIAGDVPPPDDLRRLAEGHQQLAILLQSTGRYEEAGKSNKMCREILERLVSQNPGNHEFRQSLAVAYHNLGMCAITRQQWEVAEDWLQQSLVIQKDLVSARPNRIQLRRTLARCHATLGIVLKRTGRFAEAVQMYAEAIRAEERIEKLLPKSRENRRYLAGNHYNLGILLERQKQYTDAGQAFQKAIGLQRRLVEEYPNYTPYQYELGRTLAALGTSLLLNHNQTQDALDLLDEAMALQRAAIKISPGSLEYFETLRSTEYWRARALTQLGKHDLAVKAIIEAPQRAGDAKSLYYAARLIAFSTATAQDDESLTEDSRKQAIDSYVKHVVRLLNEAVDNGFADADQLESEAAFDPVRGQKEFKELLARLRKIDVSPSDKDAPEMKLAQAKRSPQDQANQHLQNAIRCEEAGNIAQAVTACRQALEILQPLAATEPTELSLQIPHVKCLMKLADLHLASERQEAAEQTAKQAIKILDQVTDRYPQNKELRWRRGKAYKQLADMLVRITSRAEEAELAQRQAIRIQEKLVRDFPEVAEGQSDLGATLNDLAFLLMRARPDKMAEATALLRQAVKHQEIALDADADNPRYRTFLSNHYILLAEALLLAGKHADAVETANALIQLPTSSAIDCYDAARAVARCAPLAAGDPTLAESEQERIAGGYHDKAIDFLQVAVQKGFRDTKRLQSDRAFQELSSREDFENLLGKLLH